MVRRLLNPRLTVQQISFRPLHAHFITELRHAVRAAIDSQELQQSPLLTEVR